MARTGQETAEAGRVTLYEQVAARIAGLIEQGTFAPGSRIPSVRALARQMEVSVSTVLEAYGYLEDQGVIAARPQSGYYVKARVPSPPAAPRIVRQMLSPTTVTTRDLSVMVMRDTILMKHIPLGAAIPNPELLPAEKLSRMLSAEARRHRTESLSYDFPPGCKPLRVQIARRMLTAGCTLDLDGIVTTSGCLEAVNLALRAICRPGDIVAVESPCYYNFLQAIEAMGLRALEIPCHPVHGMSLDALRYAIDHHPVRACVVVTNFSNPLGCLMPDDHKRELVEILGARDIPLIEDDLIGDLSYSQHRPAVAKNYDRKGLVLLCSSFSKTLAPGYRVGWIAPGRFQDEVERQKALANVATAMPTQLAIAEFLANGGYDHHLRTVRRVYARQASLMADAVGRHFPEGTRVSSPAGGYVLWVECPEYVDVLKLYGLAIGAGITICPGPIFSARGKYGNCIRLNAAFWSPRVEQAVETLGGFAAEMRGS